MTGFIGRPKWVSFDYFRKSAIAPLRPFVPFLIRVKDGTTEEEWSAVADTGAERTLLDAELADVLGVALLESTGEPVYGLGTEQLIGYPAFVEVQVKGFSEWVPIKVFFVRSLGTSGVFGQGSFFTEFDALFEKRTNHFCLRKVSKLTWTTDILDILPL